MNADRGQQIESLCHAALARDAEGRAAFLDEACAGDADLRREVESLLAGQAKAGGFLETPAWEAAPTPLTPGIRLGPYEIDAPIGAGPSTGVRRSA
jgi:eukaryotic-like serine/threonine-protein kinase